MSRCAILIVTLLGLLKTGSLSGQCSDRVSHTSGAATINGTVVTVTPDGIVTTNSVYCASTLPYFIGYSGTSGDGSYTFYFLPPVSALSLNFSGISNDLGGAEEVALYVNGLHYSIPAAGTPNGCDPMAELSPSGNIAGCAGCGISGWKGTIINGPIALLTVKDSVIHGLPNGAIFSLFICTGDVGLEEHLSTTGYRLFPQPLLSEATLQLNRNLEDATLIIYNLYGQPVKELHHLSGSSIPVRREELSAGIYSMRLSEDRKIIATERLIIAD
jgi:hypothetical protein